MRSASPRVCGEGLLDEDVDAGAEKLLGDSGVVDGGNADGSGVEVAGWRREARRRLGRRGCCR